MNNELLLKAKAAKDAAVVIATLTSEEKDEALGLIEKALLERADEILEANALDVKSAEEKGTSKSMIDRLTLTKGRIEGIAEGVRQVISLKDPIGDVVEQSIRTNGLSIKKVRVPLGVIGMIYESRPNVTVDAAVLSLKAGSSALLRGSKSAVKSNEKLVEVIKDALDRSKIPSDAVVLVDSSSHDTVDELMSLRGLVDLIIPRGGASLIRRVVENSKVPVLETGVGNCHLYIDKAADAEMAEKILINAKTQRPSVCNAAETLLIHKDSGMALNLCKCLKAAGVTVHGCERICEIFPEAIPAGEKDFAEEYLSFDMAVKLVDSLDEAISHIRRYGTGHTEAIVTSDRAAADKFIREVDAAAVNVNASTRFTDGFEYGFGAEIGISTQKMHARGPLGLREITSYKYIVEGNGQVRV